MRIESIAISPRKGIRKTLVKAICILKNYGLKGDAHAGTWHRQVSFLAKEAIDRARSQGLNIGFGDFAENIATSGVDWPSLSLGTKVHLGKEVIVEITQIGKRCHTKCAIYQMAGDCIMPREGVFAKVLAGGRIQCGDEIAILRPPE